MRIVVIWILILGASAVLSTKTSLKKAPKNFPSQFTTSFNETDLINPSFLPNKVNTLYFDGQNQRAREVAPTAKNWIEDYYLFYKAPGAEPGSTAAKSYTKFLFNPYYPKNAPNNCYYKTAALANTTLLFEQIWWTVAPTSLNEPYFFMFEYPDDMAYYGVQYIPELNVYADRWDSRTMCNLVSSNIGVVPCTSVFQSRDENQVTLKQIRAHAATGPFDTDMYLIRVFFNFQPSVSDSDFELPQNWPAYCGYGDAGFIFPTYKNVWADATNNNFTISLTARPVQALGGKVKVSFLPVVTEYYNCPTCVVLNPQTLFFDTTNWNIPQYVMLNYNKTGCEQLDIKASGGGYDWQYNEDINLIAMEACHYDPVSQYCKEGFHICGGSR